VINLMLEAEDDEDVACTVEDTEAIGRSRSFSQRDGRKGGQGYKNRDDDPVLGCAVQTTR
jgi:hypothetical protein